MFRSDFHFKQIVAGHFSGVGKMVLTDRSGIGESVPAMSPSRNEKFWRNLTLTICTGRVVWVNRSTKEARRHCHGGRA